MLLTDQPPLWLAELTHYESSIQTVASSLGIDLTAKFALARRHIGTKIEIFLKRNGSDGLDASNVVVTAELRHWLMLHTLAETYRDGYHSSLNDRYEAKWRLYASESLSAERELYDAGVGVVQEPVPRPHRPEAGLLAGTQPGATYYVTTAWVNAKGDESAASEFAVIDAPDGHTLTVTPGVPPASTAGWTVYVGTSDSNGALQTPTPLPIDTTWTLPPTGIRNGPGAGDGQQPDQYITVDRRIWKG